MSSLKLNRLFLFISLVSVCDFFSSQAFAVINGVRTEKYKNVKLMLMENMVILPGSNELTQQTDTCTATQIAPQWLITAGHCVTNIDGNNSLSVGGNAWVRDTDSTQTLLKVKATYPHPYYQKYRYYHYVNYPAYADIPPLESTVFDIALVELETSVAEPKGGFAKLGLKTNPFSSLDWMQIVGYGLGKFGDNNSSGVKRYGVILNIAVDKLGFLSFLGHGKQKESQATAREVAAAYGDSG